MTKKRSRMSRGGQSGQFPPEVGGNKPLQDIGEHVPKGGAELAHAGDRPRAAIKGEQPPGAAGSGGPHGSEKESLGEPPSNTALGGLPRGKPI